MIIRSLLENGDPNHAAIYSSNGSISYHELAAQVDELTNQLTDFALDKGRQIAMALPNWLEVIASFLAASTVGTAAPLNPSYTLDEFKFYLQDTDARALIVPANSAEAARAAADECNVLIIDALIDNHGRVRFSTGGKLNTAGRNEEQPEDIALILHTSGTTSQPKRVPLSHANLLTSAGNVANTYQLTAQDVSLCVMPLFHVHGLVASTLATFATGGTVVVPPKFNPLSFWSIVREQGATWYSAVPTIHQVLLSRAKGKRPEGAEQLHFIRSCSASLSPQLMADMEAAFGAPVLEAYGMTEAAHQMASNPLPPAVHKPGSVGTGTNVGVAVMDEAGNLLPAGTQGEVVVRGPNVTRGYKNNPEANAASFTNGWFRTGDRGVLDADGYLTLIGRIKELINRGGEKISPLEVDAVLLDHPAVAEVATFAAPDPKYGEEVHAAVVLKGDATVEELQAHCGTRLANFKVPKVIHLTKELPRTATGKVQRRHVAATFLEKKEL